MPPTLQLLMRHDSIETTMDFYVERNAQDAAEDIWQAFSDTSSDTSHKTTKNATQVDDVNVESY